MTRRCRPTAHHWRIAAALAMGVAQVDGWYETLLVRACTTCGYTEVWHGEQSLEAQKVRLREVESLPSL